jgi:rsbT co-antagonist protein RsbR
MYTAPAANLQLARFLLWLIGIATLAVGVYFSLWLFFRDPFFLALMGFSFASGCGIGLGRWLALRGAIQPAMITCVITMLVAALLFILIAPPLFPIMVLLPILAVATALPYTNTLWLTRLLWIAAGSAILLALLSRVPLLNLPVPAAIPNIVAPLIAPAVTGAILLLLQQFHTRINTALSSSEQARAELEATQAQLEAQVAARTAALQHALADLEDRSRSQSRLLVELQAQRDAIRELSVPVLPVSNDELVIPLVGALDSTRLTQLQAQALQMIEQRRARRFILDVTGVPIIDTQVAQGLISVTQAARLLGTEAILVGIRPEVAQALVGLGVELHGIRSYADLASALGRGTGT